MNRSRSSLGAVGLSLLVTGLMFSACADDTAEGRSGRGEGSQIRLGVEGPVLVPTWVKAGDGAKAAAEDDGAIDLSWNAPATVDPSAAQAQVQAMVTQGVDGLGISPFPTEPWGAALTRFGEKVQPTVAFGFQPTVSVDQLESSPVKTYVGSGTISTGYDLAIAAIEKAGLGEDTTGTVLLGQCVPGDSGLVWARIEGVRRAVEEKLPNAEIVDFDAGVDLNDNTQSWRAAIASNDDIVFTAGACEPDGGSMIQAKESAGIEAVSVAFEPTPPVLDGVRDGSITAVGTMGNFHVGWVLVKLLADDVRDVNPMPEGWVDTGFYIFTQDDIEANMTGLDYEDAGYEDYWTAKAKEILANLDAHTKPLADIYE